MTIFSNIVFNDTRENVRIRNRKLINWNIKDSDIKGKGRIKNISATGMLLETSSSFNLIDRCIFNFNSLLGNNNFVPQSGRLVWHKKVGFAKQKYLLGIEFVEASEEVLSNLRERIQKYVLMLSRIQVANSILNPIFAVSAVCLTMYVLWMSSAIYKDMNISNARMLKVANDQSVVVRNYSNLYRDAELKLASVTEELNATKSLYYESEVMLSGVNKELETTKAILAQTEILLSEANAGNLKLKGEMQSLSQLDVKKLTKIKNELNDKIVSLRNKNQKLNEDIILLQNQLAFFNGDVKSLSKGNTLLTLYRSKIKLVKSKIAHFKREARKVRASALKERDRIQSIIGNNGFFVKDGETVIVDMEKYNNVTLSSEIASQGMDKKPEVEIDVSFFE